ncbi:MAG: bifunctional YncE family protein/alkaline phosphatase family protein [Phycisphaerales bacterium]|nr:MAG: bifunctional YncE family protein/alkaline phosphatase family protein [Phycisphaerales bacterium]
MKTNDRDMATLLPPWRFWVMLLVSSFLLIAGCSRRATSYFNTEPVGEIAPQRYVTPVHQVLTPVGIQVDLPGMRPQAVALSPNGHLLATAGKTQELVLIDPQNGNIKQRVALPSSEALDPNDVSSHLLKPDKSGQLSYTGLIFSPDGSRIYLSNVNGDVKVFRVGPEGQVSGLPPIALPAANAPWRKEEIPAGLAISRDGRRLYVVLNLSNRLAEIDTATGNVLRLWQVGFAPYDVVLAGDKAYVSNWGGRIPADDSLTGPAGQGTRVRVDPVRHIASEGSVSVIHLTREMPAGEIMAGLHSSGITCSPNGRYIVVANAGSDTLSVIDTRTNDVVETIWAKRSPADLFGASPNALVFAPSGDLLYVANGTQNAIAVFRFRAGKCKLLGLVPVGWFPGAITYDRTRHRLVVANIKGVGSTQGLVESRANISNSRQYHGTLSLVPVPKSRELPALTRRVLDNYRYPLLKDASRPARTNEPPRAIPERVGEPSVFEHVVYIIKENRTYDQVLGDIPKGNGDPSLCIFGAEITPNQHKMVREFVLLDNTYCSGILSADGHQWSDSAFATDYMEKSFAGFPRSYPDGMEDSDVDALAYAPSGFIWDNAIAHGKSLRVYGEFAITETSWVDPDRKGRLTFLDYYRDFADQTGLINISSRPAIESLRPYLNMQTVGWDMDIPDVFRAAQFVRELREYERSGKLPHLIIICLPNDHTSGTRAGAPTPAAQVADNDLAFGQIVEAISHSRFWAKTCIFAIEDDPQAGWDHVSGYRTTAYVISPYTKREAVISTQYNQTSILRSIELILGLPPMNQFDATATPMSDCFSTEPDFTPYVAVPANVPLDQMNPDPKKISNATLRKDALASARLPLEQVDRCPEDVLNRILWRAMKGPHQPYPQWAVMADVEEDERDID